MTLTIKANSEFLHVGGYVKKVQQLVINKGFGVCTSNSDLRFVDF